MHSDHRSGPKPKSLWTTHTSSSAHQIPKNSSHRFHGAGSGGQVEMGMFAIGPELVGASEKLSHHHAGTDSITRFPGKLIQTLKDALEPGTIGKLQGLTGELIANFTHISACDFSFSPSPVALQLADEMKMTQLQGPAFLGGQRGDAPNLVGHQRSYVLLHSGCNGADGLRPATDFLPTGKKQRVQENSAVLMAGFQSHQIQHPRTSVEAKVKTIDQKNQRSWQLHRSGVGHKTTHNVVKPVAQRPVRKTVVASCKVFQCPPLQQNCLQQSNRRSPMTTTSPFLPCSPGALAVAALATTRSKAMNFCPTTARFRMQRLHARELCVYCRSKWARYQ